MIPPQMNNQGLFSSNFGLRDKYLSWAHRIDTVLSQYILFFKLYIKFLHKYQSWLCRDFCIHIFGHCAVLGSVAQSCPNLCIPMDCHTPLSMGLSRQEYWRGLWCPSLGDLPDPGIELGFPALLANSFYLFFYFF